MGCICILNPAKIHHVDKTHLSHQSSVLQVFQFSHGRRWKAWQAALKHLHPSLTTLEPALAVWSSLGLCRVLHRKLRCMLTEPYRTVPDWFTSCPSLEYIWSHPGILGVSYSNIGLEKLYPSFSPITKPIRSTRFPIFPNTSYPGTDCTPFYWCHCNRTSVVHSTWQQFKFCD